MKGAGMLCTGPINSATRWSVVACFASIRRVNPGFPQHLKSFAGNERDTCASEFLPIVIVYYGTRYPEELHCYDKYPFVPFPRSHQVITSLCAPNSNCDNSRNRDVQPQ